MPRARRRDAHHRLRSAWHGSAAVWWRMLFRVSWLATPCRQRGDQRSIDPNRAEFRCAAGKSERLVASGQGFGEEGGVVVEIGLEFGGKVLLVVDRIHRAHRYTRSAVHTLVGVDVQRPAALVDAIDRAFLH